MLVPSDPSLKASSYNSKSSGAIHSTLCLLNSAGRPLVLGDLSLARERIAATISSRVIGISSFLAS